MGRIARRSLVLAGVVAGSWSSFFGADLQLQAMPDSRGCPVQMSARVIAHAAVQPLASTRGHVNTLRVTLSGERVAEIAMVKVSVVHSTAKGQMTPASIGGSEERVKTFELDRSSIHDGIFEGSVSLPWTNIRLVRVDSIAYTSGPTWRATHQEYCVASPDGSQLLSSTR